MSTCNVQLRQEVFQDDARKIINWLEDHDVVRYLNESQDVGESINRVMQRINMPILTHIFNQNGSFFMITEEEEPIGFLRLVPKGKTAEIVVVIGQKDKWNRGLGKKAISHGLKHAFFKWRMDEVIARINHENERSIRMFHKIGFKQDKKLIKEMQYSISMEEFLKLA